MELLSVITDSPLSDFHIGFQNACVSIDLMRRLANSFSCPVLLFYLTLTNLVSQQPPGETLRSLKVSPDLEATLWASEPNVVNPTNMDIDERGRIWITEAVNYRRQLRQQPDYRDEGDRITILEDTDQDGKADKMKLFVQDPSLRSPLGIAVLGDRVVVSQSPNVIVYTKDAKDRILKREVFLTGWGGEDHDHGVHAIVYGPDGYYYFNNGDQGLDVTDRGGRRIVSGPDQEFYAGSALRVRPDGTGLEVLGHNFRNPYELTLDSFGNIWQSDNDDDGNEWARINYVMRGGNHGYWGPGGKRWREDRGSHFHQENPGVVPTVLRTGFGSPCGIVVYEGDLLPSRFRGNLLHVDNGPRVLRLYQINNQDAGFTITSETTIDGADTWFRPSDVAVAPDGSIFIADWYDAVVGGHQMKDKEMGRIYRLAPPGHRPRRVRVDLSSAEGRAAALSSPAQAIRHLAHDHYQKMSSGAVEELARLLKKGNSVLEARVLWLLGAAGPNGLKHVLARRQSPDFKFRLLAVRILRENHPDFLNTVQPMISDRNPQVRREIALALKDFSGPAARDSWIQLATQYDGQDRWYLEALAIGARGKESRLYTDLRHSFPGAWDSKLGRLLWVLHPTESVDFLKKTLQDKSLKVEQRAEALTALSAQPSPEVGRFLAGFAIGEAPSQLRAQAATELIRQLFSQWEGLRQWSGIEPVLRQALNWDSVRMRALDLMGDLGDTVYTEDVFEQATAADLPVEVRVEAFRTVGRLGGSDISRRLEKFLQTSTGTIRLAAIQALGASNDAGARVALEALIRSDESNEIRSEAVRALGGSATGIHLLLDLAEAGQLPKELQGSAVIAVNRSRNQEIQKRVEKVLPMFTTRTRDRIQRPRAFFNRVQGRPDIGREIYSGQGQCVACHNVGGGSARIGPDLATIGEKLGRQGLFESIVNPSGGVAPEYVTWTIDTRSAGEVRGMIRADTSEHLAILDLSGKAQTFAKTDVLERRREPLSAMPNLVGLLSEQELADLIAYLETLRGN